MLFFIYRIDKPGHSKLRLEHYRAHLDYLKPFKQQLVLGGPTLAGDGETMTGSVVILEAPDRAAVDVFLANDPFNKVALFQTTIIERWRQGKHNFE
jgi:uncharacterized protein